MFFKSFTRSICIFMSLLLLFTGCGLRTGDKGEPKTTAKFSEGEFACLHQISEEVNKYVSGEMKLKNLQQFAACLQKALRSFAYYAEGDDSRGYRPQELVDFLNKHFLTKNKIGPGLMREAMNIKALLTGGSAEFISHEEFECFVQMIGLVAEEAERHLPFIAMYGIGSKQVVGEKVSYEQMEQAQAALKATAQRVADVFKSSKFTYKLSSLQAFVDEVRQLLKWREHHQDVFESKDLVQLIGAYKSILTGTSADQITPPDWESLLTSSADVLGAVVEFQFVIRKEELFQGRSLENFIVYIEKIFTVIQNSIQKQPGNVITYQSLDHLVDSFDKIKFLPMGLRASSLKPVVRAAFGRVLRDPTLQPGRGEANGLTTPALNEARKEFYIWADSQRYISELANRDFSIKGFYPSLQNLNKNDLSKLFSLTNEQDPRVQHITYIVKNVRPMFRERDSRVWLVPESEREKYQVRHNLANLGRLNIFGSLMRLLIRGFAARERALNMSGLTIDEMENFYQTIKDLGMDIKLMDPRSKQVGIRSFREGNMFTFSGNGLQAESKDGKHLLSFVEGLELLAFIWSGGQVRTQFYENGMKACELPNIENDIFGNKKMNMKCFFDHIADNRFTEIANLPHMRNYMWNLKGDRKAAFESALMGIAKIRCENPSLIEQAELATFSTILHYVEGLFVIYDRDRSGTLNGYEIMAAFPRFHVFLGEQVQKLKKKSYDVAMLKSIFAFLVEERRFPTSFGDKAEIALERYRYFDKDPEQYSFAKMDKLKPQARPAVTKLALDRQGLVEVLAMLNNANKAAEPCAKK
ncbi:MAG: hypothetical protein AABZ31_06500 [Bdellovibrionota bacterium]